MLSSDGVLMPFMPGPRRGLNVELPVGVDGAVETSRDGVVASSKQMADGDRRSIVFLILMGREMQEGKSESLMPNKGFHSTRGLEARRKEVRQASSRLPFLERPVGMMLLFEQERRSCM